MLFRKLETEIAQKEKEKIRERAEPENKVHFGFTLQPSRLINLSLCQLRSQRASVAKYQPIDVRHATSKSAQRVSNVSRARCPANYVQRKWTSWRRAGLCFKRVVNIFHDVFSALGLLVSLQSPNYSRTNGSTNLAQWAAHNPIYP